MKILICRAKIVSILSNKGVVKKPTPGHIIVKVLKVKPKRNYGSSKVKNHPSQKVEQEQVSFNASHATRGQRNDIQSPGEKTVNQEFLYPAKLSFKNKECKIKMFLDKQRQRIHCLAEFLDVKGGP